MRTAKLLFIILFYLFHHINASAVFYTVPSAELESGFGILTNGTVTSLTDSALRNLATETKIALLNENTIAVYGPLQYYGDAQSALVFYNIKTSTWSIFGQNNLSPFIFSSVDSILPIDENNFVIVGDIVLANNLDLPFNNIASCDNTGDCQPMGNGLSNYQKSCGLVLGDMIYACYIDNNNNLNIASWDGNSWTTILYIWTDGTGYISYGNDQLYISFYGYLSNNNTVMCDPSATVWSGAVWNGSCWDSVNIPHSLFWRVYMFYFEPTLYGIFTTDSSSFLTKYENDTWEELFPEEELYPIGVSNGVMYTILDEGSENYIKGINLTSGDSIWYLKTFCNTSLSAILYNNTIVYICSGYETVSLMQLDPITNSTSAIATSNEFSTQHLVISDLCIMGDKMIVSGNFIYAGNYMCTNVALWNSNEWTCLPFNEDLSQDYQLTKCVAAGDTFALYYNQLSNGSALFALYDPNTNEINVFSLPSNYYTKLISMSYSNSKVYMLLNDNPHIHIFDMNTYNWTEIPSVDNAFSMAIDNNDVMYLGGQFSVNKTDMPYYYLFAKRNISSWEWLPVVPFAGKNGIIYSMTLGSVPNSNATIYVVGAFEGGVLGINSDGVVVDNVYHGIDLICNLIVHGQDDFYILCETQLFLFDMYRYDGISVNKILTSTTLVLGTGYGPSSPTKPKKSPIGWYWYLAGGAIGAVLVLVVVIVIIRRVRKNRHEYVLIPQYKELTQNEIPVKEIKDISLVEKIGSGQFGDVYKAIMENTTTVAVKTLKSNQSAELEKEIGILCQLNHPHIVRFYGIHHSLDTTMIVLEYMSFGNLSRLLQIKRTDITLADMYKLCQHITNGMLHLEENHVVHRDLACRNVLISQDPEGKYIAKISDFGLSRAVENDYYRTDEKTMPVKWTAIESIKYGIFTTKSDVWSFGVLLWELFSYGMIPYPGMRNATVIEQVSAGYRLASPEGCPNEIFTLMQSCWITEPDQRPTFAEIAAKFNSWNSQQDKQPQLMAEVSNEDFYN